MTKEVKGSFGLMHLTLCGDFTQLPPVAGQPLYTASKKTSVKGIGEQAGYNLYQTFDTVAILEENMRAVADPEWKAVLYLIRVGALPRSDCVLLSGLVGSSDRLPAISEQLALQRPRCHRAALDDDAHLQRDCLRSGWKVAVPAGLARRYEGHPHVGVVALDRLGQCEAQQLRGSLTAGSGAESMIAKDAAPPRPRRGGSCTPPAMNRSAHSVQCGRRAGSSAAPCWKTPADRGR